MKHEYVGYIYCLHRAYRDLEGDNVHSLTVADDNPRLLAVRCCPYTWSPIQRFLNGRPFYSLAVSTFVLLQQVRKCPGGGKLHGSDMSERATLESGGLTPQKMFKYSHAPAIVITIPAQRIKGI